MTVGDVAGVCAAVLAALTLVVVVYQVTDVIQTRRERQRLLARRLLGALADYKVTIENGLQQAEERISLAAERRRDNASVGYDRRLNPTWWVDADMCPRLNADLLNLINDSDVFGSTVVSKLVEAQELIGALSDCVAATATLQLNAIEGAENHRVLVLARTTIKQVQAAREAISPFWTESKH